MEPKAISKPKQVLKKNSPEVKSTVNSSPILKKVISKVQSVH